MIFALIVGSILGLSKLSAVPALLILAAALAVKLLVDVRWDRVPFLGMVSPYVVYCHNLALAGERLEHAWISYALQLFVFGALLGAAAFGLIRYFF